MNPFPLGHANVHRKDLGREDGGVVEGVRVGERRTLGNKVALLYTIRESQRQNWL